MVTTELGIVSSGGGAGGSAVDGSGNLKVAEQFAPAAEDNTRGVLAVAIKPLAVSTYSPSIYKDAGTVTKANIKNTAGNVFGFAIENKNSTLRYFQIHNKATAPAGSDTAALFMPIPANGMIVVGNELLTAAGINMATGIGWAVSTTAGTFTDSATAADHTTTVIYL